MSINECDLLASTAGKGNNQMEQNKKTALTDNPAKNWSDTVVRLARNMGEIDEVPWSHSGGIYGEVEAS